MDAKIKFGQKVKYLRTQRNISQEKLSQMASLDRTYIPSIEKGVRNVSITVIEKLATAFNMTISELMNDL